MLNSLRRSVSKGAIWPPIEYELVDLRDKIKGKVLNAGAGWRDVSHLVDGELVNQDLTWPDDRRENIHIRSPLHEIPTPDNSFDCILCIAVLEHVQNPEDVTAELFRVLKPGGTIIASIPFLQPEHKVPTDYQRYTRDGMETLFTKHGFVSPTIKPLFSVYHTLHWIIYEWLHMKNTLLYKGLRVCLLPPIAYLARNSDLTSDVVASAFRIVANKPS